MEAIGVASARREPMKERGRVADLYLAHASAAFRVAYLITGDRALAEDLTHEAFIKVVGRFQDLRDRAAFQAYFRRAVVNLAHSHFRRARLERDYLRAETVSARPSVEELPEPRDDLRQALLGLPVRQRAAIVLRFYEDLSEYQTADAMGTSPEAVKALVSRGMKSLRKQVTYEGRSTGGRSS